MSPALITPDELKQWRARRGYSLREVADRLGVASPNTIKTWEDARVEIPGPAEMLLRWLIRGEVPFQTEMDAMAPALREAMGKVEMTLEAFLECQRRALAGGFPSVTEWIATLIREELSGPALRHESDLALVSEAARAYGVTGSTAAGTAAVQGPLQEAARAFLQQREEAAGEPADAAPPGTAPKVQGNAPPARGRADIRLENP